MGNIFNQDFQDFIQALNKFEVEYILVGGYAVILRGYSRTTGDMDIWVNKTEENYKKLFKAFSFFGLSISDMTKENFLQNKDFDVFSYGRPPVSIDIMTALKGLIFEQAFENKEIYDFEGFLINLISKQDLIIAKKAANRFKDINDIEHLK
jgi:predicted nucleotidyltransferase